MRVLALDAALARASAAVLRGERVLAEAHEDGLRGPVARLPSIVRAALAGAGAPPPALIAVTVGPGSFTGLRAALALAHGLGLGWGVPVVGVGVAEAFRAARPGEPDGRPCWVAIGARRGHVYLDREGAAELWPLDALPAPPGPIALAGDAADPVAEALAARGATVAPATGRLPCLRAVARLGRLRAAGALPALPALPIYVEPPRVTAPARATPARTAP